MRGIHLTILIKSCPTEGKKQFDTWNVQFAMFNVQEDVCETDCADLIAVSGQLICADCGQIKVSQLYQVDVNQFNQSSAQGPVNSISISEANPLYHKDNEVFETFFRHHSVLHRQVKEQSWRWFCQSRQGTEWENKYNISITSNGVMGACILMAIQTHHGPYFSFWSQIIEEYFHLKKAKLKKSVLVLQNIHTVTVLIAKEEPMSIVQTILDHFCHILHISPFQIDADCLKNLPVSSQLNPTLLASKILCDRCIHIYQLPKAHALKFISNLAHVSRTMLSKI